MMRTAGILFGSIVLAGCATPVSTVSRPDAYYESSLTPGTDMSLFAGDAAVLSDAAIGNILDYKYQPPALSRIALMPFGRETWSQWSEELSISTDQLEQNVIETLRSSPRVYDASYLPSILIPKNRTVPYLREAAARYQADLLLVYRSYCRSFEKYRMFRANEARAYCGVEAILLDTRTGLVPFTSVASKTFDVRKTDADTNFQETVLKAQLAAVADALAEVSGQIVAFLNEVG